MGSSHSRNANGVTVLAPARARPQGRARWLPGGRSAGKGWSCRWRCCWSGRRWSSAGWVSAYLLPPPSEIGRTLVGARRRRDPLRASGRQHPARLVGFAIGASLALVVGALVGLSRRAEAYLDPTFQALRAIPSLAWVPLLLLWLGIDEAPKITLIAIGAFLPGVSQFRRRLFRTSTASWSKSGGIFGLQGVPLVRRIFLPATLPNLFTGLRSGLSLAWMFLVAAELIAATRGWGIC